MKKINKKLGFTLVEMLVVISIIAILSTVLAGGYSNSQKSARDASRKLNLKSISDALNSYYADNGIYPEEDSLVDNNGEFISDNIIYMKKVPVETGRMVPIDYNLGLSKKSFRLFTNLENDEDKDCISKAICASPDLGYDIGSGCCYIITSSNVGLTGTLP